MKNFLRSALAATIMSASLMTATVAPAKADTTSTILIGAAALAAAATLVNVSNKDHAANTIVGYLPNGDAVFQDGHVQERNGSTYYPGNQGQTLQCNGQQCYVVANNGYNGNYNGGYNASYGTGYTVNGYFGNTGYYNTNNRNHSANNRNYNASNRNYNTNTRNDNNRHPRGSNYPPH